MSTIVVLSGNPNPPSKTVSVATGVAQSLNHFPPVSSLEVKNSTRRSGQGHQHDSSVGDIGAALGPLAVFALAVGVGPTPALVVT